MGLTPVSRNNPLSNTFLLRQNMCRLIKAHFLEEEADCQNGLEFLSACCQEVLERDNKIN